MVRRLVLWCTYTGAPWLVTWGARERGWDHSFLHTLTTHPDRVPHPLSPQLTQTPSPGVLILPFSAPRAREAGDLDKVTLEHGQRAEGQVLALLKGLLQLAQSGHPLWGAWQWIQVPNVPKPVHSGCSKGGHLGTESGTQTLQPTGPGSA